MIRALIVDDEPLPRERARTLLAERPDIELIGECRDGREAVNVILAERPDLIFLDIQMPALDGFEVIEAISAEYLPAIVFITAFDEYAIRAFEVNAIDYLLKPINAARFEQALRRATDRLNQSNANVPAPERKLLDLIAGLRAAGHTPRGSSFAPARNCLSCAPPTWTGLTRRIITCACTLRAGNIWCARR